LRSVSLVLPCVANSRLLWKNRTITPEIMPEGDRRVKQGVARMTTERPGAGRGRPRAFDLDQAVDIAMELFWIRGYEGTSIADLTKAIGISAASLYAAFGSKEDLYRRALDRYVAVWGAAAGELLAAQTPAFTMIAGILGDAARRFAGEASPPGCLISAAVLRAAPENAGAIALVAARRAAFREAIASRFVLARERGELPADQDVDALARFYDSVMQGMAVQARDGATVEQLEAVASLAMLAWPAEHLLDTGGLQTGFTNFTHDEAS
jgi:AcrR family transcriptional regulator